MKLVLAVTLLMCAQSLSFAQVDAKHPEFEVASVKQVAPVGSQSSPSSGGQRLTGAGRIIVSEDRASYQGVTLKRLLMSAYDLKAFQISGPEWIETERYDVIATIPEGAAKEDVPAMLQKLLADRFHVALHTEMKEQPAYNLRVGKDGPKLKPASDDQRQSTGFTMRDMGQSELNFTAVTMADFANMLSVRLDRVVTDGTGLAGRFDIALPVDAQDLRPGSDSLASSLFGAVQGVGLKLEPGKAPVKLLIVDKAQKIPTEN